MSFFSADVFSGVFTSADWSQTWTLWSQAGAGAVVAVVTVRVTSCAFGNGRRRLGRQQRGRGGQGEVRCALGSFSDFVGLLVSVASSLPAALLPGFDQFDQSFGSGPLAPPDRTQFIKTV